MLLVLVLASLVSAAEAACPAGYTQINGGDCFKLYTSQQTFDTAEAICVQDGGHLASVHSLTEQNALTSMNGVTTPLIGMKCTDTTVGHCTWKDGSVVDYANFPGGGPIIEYGSCAHLSSADTLWYSWNCAATIGQFFCRVAFNAPVNTCTGDYVAFNGGCAAVKKTALTKADAEASCVLDGGHLASIHSDADNTFYAQLASNQGLNNNIFIGLANTCTTCPVTGNSYTWSDATQYNYNKFAAPNFPNTLFGDCVQMMMSNEFGTLGQWTNIPCSTPLAYVCWKGNTALIPKAPAVCQGIQFYYDEGTIYSPNFPISIPASQSCEYILATNVGTKVSVTFPSFSTDAGSYLSLYDGLDDLTPKNKLSGTVNPQVSYESASNVMKMVFTASAFPTGQGWQANFATVAIVPPEPTTEGPLEPSGQCPQQQYTADVTVQSPNYPNPYPVLSDCLYYIQSTANRKLAIEFTFVDTDQCCDYVVVFDGPTNNSRVLAIVSGQSGAQVQTFYSTGSTLTLEFTSGSIYKGKKGWSAQVYNR